MKAGKLITGTLTCAAAALVAVTALSTSAYALPPESRAVSFRCFDPSGTLYGSITSPFTGTLTTSDPGGTAAQKMKLATTWLPPLSVAPNTLPFVFRTVQTSAGGSGVGTVWDFAGSNHPALGLGPTTFGPAPTSARIAAGTTIRFKETSGALPSTTNWSLRFKNPIPGTSNDIYCAGGQSSGSGDFSF
ncbi:hypothetical protein ACWGR4_23255 [Embleya sp. NPDC055664]